jgi:hypothetical protein
LYCLFFKSRQTTRNKTNIFKEMQVRFYRESLIGGLRDQTVSTTVNLKLRKYFESSDLALVFQELYMSYLRAEMLMLSYYV